MERFPKTFKYSFADHLATGILVCSVYLFRWIPLKAVVFFSKVLGFLTFYLHKKYRERILGNLFFAFGNEKDMKEIRRLAKEVFCHFCLTPLETLFLVANGFPLERYISKVKIEGKENLEAALARGRGVIALGAHLGSFTLVGSRLAVEGYPFNLIVNVGSYPKIWRRLAEYQKVVGQQTIPVKPASASIKKSLNCLHRNEILYIVADERQRRGGLPAPFFGQIAYTPPGAAIFSLKTGAPILPVFVLRDNDVNRTLVIGSPLQFERSEDEKKDIERLTAQFTKVIEETVRQYPDQWAWLNKRWKLPRSTPS
ncbi:MAG: lysophospholipid acyltransferase family protein [Thermodesulfobacteriota bacterium]